MLIEHELCCQLQEIQACQQHVLDMCDDRNSYEFNDVLHTDTQTFAMNFDGGCLRTLKAYHVCLKQFVTCGYKRSDQQFV